MHPYCRVSDYLSFSLRVDGGRFDVCVSSLPLRLS